ncbi:MAG: hypothetical protein K2K48_04010 [Anaeroplasmataceae bacterium]|nr:hypothetical protein [Anaeroplasmataceae bacterium]
MGKHNGKIPLIIQVIFMYAFYICFGVAVIICCMGEELSNQLILIMWILFFLCFGIGFVNVIVAILHIFLKSQKPTMVTIIAKFSLIPWYIMNFIFWALAVVIFIHPFFLPIVPIIFVLGVSSTYFFMICTGVHNLSYVIKLVKNKELKLTGGIIVSVIFHFIFVLDIIGSFALHYYLKPYSNQKIEKAAEAIIEEK